MIAKCPVCGNTNQDEFAVISEGQRIPGPKGHIINRKDYKVVCLCCRATGPDADTKEEAVERWNKREV
ncbi:MAG: hypothetical protein LBQ88_07290 [Treponema sp.]|jgi:Lar family restriction alleviation protein|nr:hypothetical protein [Treponema sp.]